MKCFDTTKASWRKEAEDRAEQRASARRTYTVRNVSPDRRIVTMPDGRVLTLVGYSPLCRVQRHGYGGITMQYRRVHRWAIRENDAAVAFVEAGRSASTASILRAAGIISPVTDR